MKFCFFLFFFFFLETGSHYVAQTSLGLSIELFSSCLSLLSAGITDTYCYA
jgi:hypothetical protein